MGGVPSGEVHRHLASAGEGRPHRHRASASELAPLEEDWDAIEEHLLAGSSSRTAWIISEELEEDYGEAFAEVLEAEASRLLGVENSTLQRMADTRFPAGELADAQALLSVLFRRHMRGNRTSESRSSDGGGGSSDVESRAERHTPRRVPSPSGRVPWQPRPTPMGC